MRERVFFFFFFFPFPSWGIIGISGSIANSATRIGIFLMYQYFRVAVWLVIYCLDFPELYFSFLTIFDQFHDRLRRRSRPRTRFQTRAAMSNLICSARITSLRIDREIPTETGFGRSPIAEIVIWRQKWFIFVPVLGRTNQFRVSFVPSQGGPARRG